MLVSWEETRRHRYGLSWKRIEQRVDWSRSSVSYYPSGVIFSNHLPFVVPATKSWDHFATAGNPRIKWRQACQSGAWLHGTRSIPVQGCSLAAAAGMDSHEEGEWSTVWCYRRCSPSPPSLIPLLLALPADRGSLSWPATRRLLRRVLRDCECGSVPGLFLTARNTAWCLNLECPSRFCSSRASGFGPWSSGWGSSSLWSDSSGAFEPEHWCLNGIDAKEGIKHQNSCTCEHIQ